MKSLKGHFLIAPPKMFDPNFFRTVVLMIQHNEEGALGLVLNRPLEMTLKKAWEQVSDTDCDIADVSSPLDPAPSNPTLENNGGDVKYETDFRSVYARVLDDWLGASSTAVLGGDFRTGAPPIV